GQRGRDAALAPRSRPDDDGDDRDRARRGPLGLDALPRALRDRPRPLRGHARGAAGRRRARAPRPRRRGCVVSRATWRRLRERLGFATLALAGFTVVGVAVALFGLVAAQGAG